MASLVVAMLSGAPLVTPKVSVIGPVTEPTHLADLFTRHGEPSFGATREEDPPKKQRLKMARFWSLAINSNTAISVRDGAVVSANKECRALTPMRLSPKEEDLGFTLGLGLAWDSGQKGDIRQQTSQPPRSYLLASCCLLAASLSTASLACRQDTLPWAYRLSN